MSPGSAWEQTSCVSFHSASSRHSAQFPFESLSVALSRAAQFFRHEPFHVSALEQLSHYDIRPQSTHTHTHRGFSIAPASERYANTVAGLVNGSRASRSLRRSRAPSVRWPHSFWGCPWPHPNMLLRCQSAPQAKTRECCPHVWIDAADLCQSLCVLVINVPRKLYSTLNHAAHPIFETPVRVPILTCRTSFPIWVSSFLGHLKPEGQNCQ